MCSEGKEKARGVKVTRTWARSDVGVSLEGSWLLELEFDDMLRSLNLWTGSMIEELVPDGESLTLNPSVLCLSDQIRCVEG